MQSLPPEVRSVPPPSFVYPEMNVESFPPMRQPALPTLRKSPEAPRPRHASRNSGYTLRSSPLAGPAIAVSRPSADDDTQRLEEQNNADSEKTRTGATPSRITTLYPTPPSSLRNIPVSRTPSPTRSTFSIQSSASSATSSTPPSPTISPVTPSGSHTRTRPHAKIHQQLPPSGRTSMPISSPAQPEYPASAALFKPDTSPDATRNWLTKTAPPTFSRARAKGVVMPVKSSAKRPQTAPAAPGARNLDRQNTSILPQGRHAYRMEPISLNDEPNEYRTISSVHNSRDSGRHPTSSDGTFVKRKPRRPRSLMSFSSRPTLLGVREEHEREGESEIEGGGAEKDTTTQDNKLFVKENVMFPVLAMKDGRGDTSVVARREPEKTIGWIRRWKNSLKRFRDSL